MDFRTIRGALGAFLSWWGGTLLTLVPVHLRRWAGGRRWRLEVSGGDFRLLHGGRPVAAGRLGADPIALPRRGPWELVVGGSDVLWRTTAVPLAAGAAAGRVVSYALHRLTPFRPEDIHYAVREMGRDGAAGTLRLAVGVVPRAAIGDILRRAGAGRSPARLWLIDDSGRPVETEHVADASGAGWRGAAVAGVVGVAVVAAGLLADARLARERDVLEAAIAEARGHAEEVARLEERLAEATLRAGTATRLRLERPLAVDTLARLTELLPEPVWLDSLELEGMTLRLGGTAPSAVAVLDLVERDAAFAGARFAAPVTLAADGAGERFALTAERRGRAP